MLFSISASSDRRYSGFALATLASESTGAAITIAGGFTTAMVYTFIAKPSATLYAKFCKEKNETDNNVDPLLRTPYYTV